MRKSRRPFSPLSDFSVNMIFSMKSPATESRRHRINVSRCVAMWMPLREQTRTLKRKTTILSLGLQNVSDICFRYVRNRRARELQRCEESIEASEESIKGHTASIEDIRKSKGEFEKEIHESDSFLANLRDNERIRKLRRNIAENKSKIDDFDMEEAAKARRQFDAKYTVEKKREGDMEAEV